jgi:hypothetical protein
VTSDVDQNEQGDTTIGRVVMTPDQLRLVLALAEPALRGTGRAGSTLPSSGEAAQRLGWKTTKFNRKLDNVCQKLAAQGVRGLHGEPGRLASNRRARLVEYALAVRLVTATTCGSSTWATTTTTSRRRPRRRRRRPRRNGRGRRTDGMLELDGYTDLERIGHGGLGDVYRATRTSTGGTVAIKVLRDVSDESVAWNRTRRELTALSRSEATPTSSQIVELLEHTPGLVMEFAPGGSVAQLLDRRGRRSNSVRRCSSVARPPRR